MALVVGSLKERNFRTGLRRANHFSGCTGYVGSSLLGFSLCGSRAVANYEGSWRGENDPIVRSSSGTLRKQLLINPSKVYCDRIHFCKVC